jgi:hypothetical protein
VEARWTLQSGVVRGIGGTIGIKGEGGFKGCNMSQIQAQLAIGSIENYFAGQGSAQVVVLGIPVDFHAGFFAGHACSLDTLKFVDPEVEQVIMQPGDFSGVYIEYGGGLPLSDIIPGLSDIIDVRADITTAIFYQGGPSFGRVGGREKMSVDITLFDVLNGHADWAVFAVLDTSGQLTVGGTANVCGRLGICPVCVKGCKGVTIKGVINTGGIDYFVDF